MGDLYLVLYALLLAFTLVFYLKRKKSFDAGAILIALYTAYAVLSVRLYNDKSSIDNYDFQDFTIRLFPLIYLFICQVISFYPILAFKPREYSRIQPPAFNLKPFAWFIIICYLLQIGYIAESLPKGLYMVLFADDGTVDLYSEVMDNQASGGIGIANIFSIFANMLYPFTVLLFFYYLSLEKRSKTILIGLGLAILIGMLEYVAKGQRGGMVKRMLLLIGTYFLFKDYLSYKINRKIKIYGLLVVSLFALFFMAMSISRFGDRDGGVLSSFNRYGGEAVINFDRYAMDDNGIRYGDRVVPLFKKILQFDNVPNNYFERRAKYPHLYINDEVFVTYVGDFCIDFGPFAAFLIIAFFSLWIRKLTLSSNAEYPFHKLILLQFTLSIFVQGGALFPYADTGNLVIIMTILLYLFFYFLYSGKLARNR